MSLKLEMRRRKMRIEGRKLRMRRSLRMRMGRWKRRKIWWRMLVLLGMEGGVSGFFERERGAGEKGKGRGYLEWICDCCRNDENGKRRHPEIGDGELHPDDWNCSRKLLEMFNQEEI
ncbi:hypothetical protein BDZ45DRAFT_179735 [Acephala macrosclerotiorum]|nr:hypothetical protein BDZ45DRAFT_179735 [Acephala macrosclerotiorum]